LRINASGLPHSEIPGSKPVCGSPELFAAYHVLHRHLAPRHSPYALSSLTIDLSYAERQKTEVRRRKCLLPPSCFLLSAIASRHTAVRLRSCERRRINVWSEKTTVCRIFSCKRALKLPAASLQLPAYLSAASRRASLKSARRSYVAGTSYLKRAGSHRASSTRLRPRPPPPAESWKLAAGS